MNRTARLVPALALSAVVIGTATAGSAVAAKMITGQDIKNGSVTSADLKNGTVSGADVKNAAVGENKLTGGVKQKLNAPSLKGYQVVTAVLPVQPNTFDYATAHCPAGKVAVGGGAGWEPGAGVHHADLQTSFPGKTLGDMFSPLEGPGDVATAWQAGGEHDSVNIQDLTVYVICVNPS